MRVLLISYDNDSYIHYFTLGLAYVASAFRESGNDVEIYQQDIYHYPESHLTEFLDNNEFDIVGTGMCGGYYQYKKLLKISEAINASKNRPKWYILGGHLVSPEPDYFFKKTHADVIFKGEADSIGKWVKYPYGGVQELPPTPIDDIPFPSWDLFDMNYYTLLRMPHCENRDRVFPMLSSRGCPFRCNFCYRMVEGYRLRSIPSIVEEINILKKDYKVNYITFADELVMCSAERARQISEAIKPLNIKWLCNGRLNYVKPDVLNVMKESGCVFINYGIESLDDTVLRTMNKKLTVEQIHKGIQATLDAGISPGFGLMWGNIGDTKESLDKEVDFLFKYDDHAQLRTLRPLTPYPGCDLYYQAINEGKLGGVEDFYEHKHVNSDLLSVNFTNLTDDEFHEALALANKRLTSNYYLTQLSQMHKTIDKLYREKDVSFRGFRQ